MTQCLGGPLSLMPWQTGHPSGMPLTLPGTPRAHMGESPEGVAAVVTVEESCAEETLPQKEKPAPGSWALRTGAEGGLMRGGDTQVSGSRWCGRSPGAWHEELKGRLCRAVCEERWGERVK